jgi:hypothetical protein
MFGGGEEYFREPDPIDRETLKRFATFCHRLRTLEKPTVKSINDTVEKATAVGETILTNELVIGSILRHIKVGTGSKQLAYWYVLDKLCKENKSTFAFALQPYLVEIASDYIPFEDPVLGPKYESMIERWDGVFPQHVVDRIWIGKKERLWAAAHQQEVEQARKEEELEWQREESRQQDADGLDDYGQPCMDYLQGRCQWGKECKQLHPAGMEGSMPLECRLGDWKCRCGVINRHFRRRCSQCVREKPQYRKEHEQSEEEKLLSKPDPLVEELARRQFGYNPMSETEAVAHWAMRLDGVTIHQFKNERSAAIRTRILGKKPATPLEAQVASQTNFGLTHVAHSVSNSGGSGEPPQKRSRVELLVPSGVAPSQGITILSKTIVERGAHDVVVPQCLYQVCVFVKECASGSSNSKLSTLEAETFFLMCRLIFSSWNTSKLAAFELFFTEIRRHLEGLGLSAQQLEQLDAMCSVAAASSKN